MKEQLLSADIHANGLVEDVYLLTPNNSSDGSVQLALTHLSKQNCKAGAPAVVLVHGQFSNRSIWFDHGGNSFAEHLTELGYDIWIPEMRGHGLSPENQRFRYNSLQDYISYDLPAIQHYLTTRVEHSAVWLGYGLSGIALCTALADQFLDINHMDGLLLLGLDDPRGAWRGHSLAKIWHWRQRIRGYIEADISAGSPEPEAYGIIHGNTNPLTANPLTVKSNAGQSQQLEFTRKLSNLCLPLLMLAGPEAGPGSALDAEKIFQFWGDRRKTFCRYPEANSEHAMIRSDYARRHIWQHIEQWLAASCAVDYGLERSA